MIISYQWLQTYFSEPLPSPEEIAETLTFGIFEVEGTEKRGDDTIFDIKVLPDRAHDCLSHRGIARELASLLQLSLREEEDVRIPEEGSTTLLVQVDDPMACRRYVGRIVRGVKVGPSPAWLSERLVSIGERSINNVVDATNYVMFDIGQPLHAFDKDKLLGEKIIVRKARKGERLSTLDGKDAVLSEEMLVITDEKSGVGDPLAIAGVKGGKRAEVNEHTSTIVLEAANFDPVLVRKTSRTLGIATDSSKRFENDVTPELAEEAMIRVTKLIQEVAAGEKMVIERTMDIYPSRQKVREIAVTSKDVNRLLGTTLLDEDIENLLNQLRFHFFKKGTPAVFTVVIPPERLDMKEVADVVEDIAHVYGYKNISTVIPSAEHVGVDAKFYYTTVIRNILIDEGFSEMYGYTFTPKGEIELQNPLAVDRAYLRANLTDSMLDALSKNSLNAPLFSLTSIRMFEFGNVFQKNGEKTLLAVGVHHARKTKEGILRGILGNLAEKIGAPSLPVIGGDDLTDSVREVVVIDIDTLINALPQPEGEYPLHESASVLYKPFSPFPFIARDIAVWVPEGTEKKIITGVIVSEGGDLLAQGPALFDEFRKDGKVSLAFRFVFQAFDRTLTDLEVNEVMDRIYTRLQALGFEVR